MGAATPTMELGKPIGRRAQRFRPQVSLPQRPRFVQELVVVQLEDKLLIDGADSLHVFEGRAAQGLLATLIALMDGTRTLDDIEQALPGVPGAEIAEAIASLYELRLVEDETASDLPSEVSSPETLAFIRRHAGATDANRNGVEAWKKLQDSKVLLFSTGAPHGPIEALRSLLLTTGIGEVTVLNRELLGLWRPSLRRQSLIVSISLGPEDIECHRSLDDWCAQHQASWLRAVLDVKAGSADLGPVFNAGENGCYHCFCRMHSRPALGNVASNDTDAQTKFFIGLVATEIIYQLSHIGVPVRGREFLRYALPDWQPQGSCWPRLPGCPRCLPAVASETRLPNTLDVAYLFENYSGHEYRPVALAKARADAAQKGLHLSQQFPRFLNCSEYKLNSQLRGLECGALDATNVPLSGKPLTCDDLATILMMTAGLRRFERRENRVKRWAATGGNLGSVQLFVAIRQVTGLEPGLYLYQPEEHSLAKFERRSGALAIDIFMRRAIACCAGELPEAMVIFVGSFGRISKKYGVFGYRLINLDAGAAASQLRTVAGSLGIGARLAPRWADDLITDQLNLDPVEEQSTAVVSLFKNHAISAAFPNRELLGAPPFARPPEEFADASLATIFEMVFRESRICEQELLCGAYAVPPDLLNVHPSHPALPLPTPTHGAYSVGDVLAKRTSVRHYTPQPVRLDQLSTMLHFAAQGDRNDWPEEHSAGRGLNLVALAFRVEGVDPGAYGYDHQAHSMVALAEAITAENALELFVQNEFAAAPVVVWITGNLAASCAAYGAFGHRQLLLRAGAVAHRLSMAALATGLGGTIVAGVIPGAARRLLGLEGYRNASLLAFAAGYQFKPFGTNPMQNEITAL